ncbi:GL10734 [Drosophila persimilis]|uniref:GL10734 n=1 Tax=Drosophila persimilis TaxID=7234 RepID=B4GAB4_DROPE|nr:GL10734 [Drosophila persimilis]
MGRVEKNQLLIPTIENSPLLILTVEKNQLLILTIENSPLQILTIGKNQLQILTIENSPLLILTVEKDQQLILTIENSPLQILTIGKNQLQILTIGISPLQVLTVVSNLLLILTIKKDPLQTPTLKNNQLKILTIESKALLILTNDHISVGLPTVQDNTGSWPLSRSLLLLFLTIPLPCLTVESKTMLIPARSVPRFLVIEKPAGAQMHMLAPNGCSPCGCGINTPQTSGLQQSAESVGPQHSRSHSGYDGPDPPQGCAICPHCGGIQEEPTVDSKATNQPSVTGMPVKKVVPVVPGKPEMPSDCECETPPISSTKLPAVKLFPLADRKDTDCPEESKTVDTLCCGCPIDPK